MKINQFLFLLVFCSLIVINFTHPMDNSSDMTEMTDLGMRCWEVMWKNPGLLKLSIPDQAYRYCEAGYKNSKISTRDVCEELCSYLPGSFYERVIKIASNVKISDKFASIIVDSFDPEFFLLNNKLFSNITNEDNISLLKESFYKKLCIMRVIPEKITKRREKDIKDKNSGYKFHFNERVLNQVKEVIKKRIKKEGSSSKNTKIQLPSFFRYCHELYDEEYTTDCYPLAITSNKRFVAALHPFGSHLYNTIISSILYSKKYNSWDCENKRAHRGRDHIILIYDLKNNETLLKLFFENCKDSDGITNIKNIKGIVHKFTSIEFSKDNSVLFLNANAAKIGDDDVVYSLGLPISLMEKKLTIDQIACLCGLKFCVEKPKKDFSDIKTLKTLQKQLKKFPVEEQAFFCDHFSDDSFNNLEQNIKVLESARVQAVNNAINFKDDCEQDDCEKKILLLSTLMPQRPYEYLKTISLFFDQWLRSIPSGPRMSRDPCTTYLPVSDIDLLKRLKNKITKTLPRNDETYYGHTSYLLTLTLIFREFTAQERKVLCNHIDKIIEGIPENDKYRRENYFWPGVHNKKTVTEKMKDITALLKSKIDENNNNCISAINSFINNNDLKKLYKVISRAKISNPLNLQIRKKINEIMQSKTNDSEIDYEDDKTDLSNLVKSLHAYCTTNGRLFSEALSGCFDLANKKIVSNKFRSQLGL